MFSLSPTFLSATSIPHCEQHKRFSQISYPGAQPSKSSESNFKRAWSYNPKFKHAVRNKANIAPDGNQKYIPALKNLPEGLLPEFMPKHVAVIMDGNRRWALERGLPVEVGHRAGGEKMRMLCRLCSQWGIKVLTVFAFSTENWVRPKEEVDFLISLFEEVIQSDIEIFMREGIRTSIIGDTSKFPESLQRLITLTEETTKDNKGLHLMTALNYGGRQDITHAAKRICTQVKDGVGQLEDITETMFAEELETKCSEFPNPDLLIRTSGEKRISNFMLWQLAYTELFFVEKKFPDLDEADFIQVLSSYQQRQRRYGGHKY